MLWNETKRKCLVTSHKTFSLKFLLFPSRLQLPTFILSVTLLFCCCLFFAFPHSLTNRPPASASFMQMALPQVWSPWLSAKQEIEIPAHRKMVYIHNRKDQAPNWEDHPQSTGPSARFLELANMLGHCSESNPSMGFCLDQQMYTIFYRGLPRKKEKNKRQSWEVWAIWIDWAEIRVPSTYTRAGTEIIEMCTFRILHRPESCTLVGNTKDNQTKLVERLSTAYPCTQTPWLGSYSASLTLLALLLLVGADSHGFNSPVASEADLQASKGISISGPAKNDREFVNVTYTTCVYMYIS